MGRKMDEMVQILQLELKQSELDLADRTEEHKVDWVSWDRGYLAAIQSLIEQAEEHGWIE